MDLGAGAEANSEIVFKKPGESDSLKSQSSSGPNKAGPRASGS